MDLNTLLDKNQNHLDFWETLEQNGGQTVMYPHVHLIPRRWGDVTDPVGGVRNTIPGKGNYRK